MHRHQVSIGMLSQNAFLVGGPLNLAELLPCVGHFAIRYTLLYLLLLWLVSVSNFCYVFFPLSYS